MNLTKLIEGYKKVFGNESSAPTSYFAPGRINLIGEHTDYNGGHVFPCAITLGTYGLASKRNDTKVKLYSENFSELGTISFDVNDLSYASKDQWTNYPKGVIHFLKERGYRIDHGMNIYFFGNIPNGAGLSSSASIELLTGVILEDLFNLDIDRLDLVKIGKEVENKFIGVNSGIMDQFAVGMGKADRAILLDTNTLTYNLVPVELSDHVIIIMNTNKRRELADSKYNERRGECEEALKELQVKLDIHSLGDLDNNHFDEYAYLISKENLLKRARHAVSENQRTLKAREALTNGDLDTFGRLVNASHVSLKYDYEVTGRELDTLVEAAWRQPGVLGARMTGAGFGGCAIAIVQKKQTDQFQKNVGRIYEQTIGYAPSFYIAEIADGAKNLTVSEV
ncbi:galactokinase [Sporolactobacillus shoreicorticis]|uniref:Galactokinase n=1 Tax=Sporolactobacillus shoreicorticis TaxID=1923877 RepID=A0ABW5S160_9BACL|nr:galactokinase [Sporolactobacillus shoreicorticis]MCO7124651.1 galactokinase [Sporolactobacillus shoreicorticis]